MNLWTKLIFLTHCSLKMCNNFITLVQVCQIWAKSGADWPPNLTNLRLFQICEPKCTEIWSEKSLGFNPFGAYLTHFWPKPDIVALVVDYVDTGEFWWKCQFLYLFAASGVAPVGVYSLQLYDILEFPAHCQRNLLHIQPPLQHLLGHGVHSVHCHTFSHCDNYCICCAATPVSWRQIQLPKIGSNG